MCELKIYKLKTRIFKRVFQIHCQPKIPLDWFIIFWVFKEQKKLQGKDQEIKLEEVENFYITKKTKDFFNYNKRDQQTRQYLFSNKLL